MKKVIFAGLMLLAAMVIMAPLPYNNGKIAWQQWEIFDNDSIGASGTLSSTTRSYAWWNTCSIWWDVLAVENYLLMDGDTVITPSYNATITGKSSSATGRILGSTLWGDTAGILKLTEVSGTFSNNESLFVGTTYIGIANGTLGDVYLTYDTEDAAETFTVGTDSIYDIIGTAKGLLVGLQDDGNAGKMTITSDGAVAYADTDTIFGHSSDDTADVVTEEIVDTVDVVLYPYMSPVSDSTSFFVVPEDADTVVVDDNLPHMQSVVIPRGKYLFWKAVAGATCGDVRLLVYVFYGY